MSETLRLVFVDDHGFGRHELAEFVARRAGMKLLARVGKPDDARANEPDLVIVDLRENPSDGLGLLCQLAAPAAAAPVVRLAASRSGGPSPALRRAAGGSAGQGGKPPLTEREWQILEHVIQGMSNKTIAKALAISHETVKLHVRHILAKLDVDSRVEAAVLAVELQLERGSRPAVPTPLRAAPRRLAQGA